MKMLLTKLFGLLVWRFLLVVATDSSKAYFPAVPIPSVWAGSLRLTANTCIRAIADLSGRSALLSSNELTEEQLEVFRQLLHKELSRVPTMKQAKRKTKEAFWHKCFDLQKEIATLEAFRRANDAEKYTANIAEGLSTHLGAAAKLQSEEIIRFVLFEFLLENSEIRRITSVNRLQLLEQMKEYCLNRMAELSQSLDGVEIEEVIANFMDKLKGDVFTVLDSVSFSVGTQMLWDVRADFVDNGNSVENIAELNAFRKVGFSQALEHVTEMYHRFGTGIVQLPLELLSTALLEAGFEVDCSLLAEALETWPQLNQLLLMTLIADLDIVHSVNRKVLLGEQCSDKQLLMELASSSRRLETKKSLLNAEKMISGNLLTFPKMALKKHLILAATPHYC